MILDILHSAEVEVGVEDIQLVVDLNRIVACRRNAAGYSSSEAMENDFDTLARTSLDILDGQVVGVLLQIFQQKNLDFELDDYRIFPCRTLRNLAVDPSEAVSTIPHHHVIDILLFDRQFAHHAYIQRTVWLHKQMKTAADTIPNVQTFDMSHW